MGIGHDGAETFDGAALMSVSRTPTNVRLILPAGALASIVFAKVVPALLERIEHLSDAATLTSTILAQASQPLAEATSASALTMTYTVDATQGWFRIDLGELWQYTHHWTHASAPSAEDTPAREAAGGVQESLGVGLLLIRQLMDDVAYVADADGNRWTLIKRLDAMHEGTEGAVLPDAPQTIKLRLPVSYRYLNVVGACIDALVDDFAPQDDAHVRLGVQLATQETLTNIIDHAYQAPGGKRAAGADGQSADEAYVDVTLTVDPQQRLFVVGTFDHGIARAELVAVPGVSTPPQARAGLLSGGALLFVSATLVNAGNYVFNLLLGRWLGPAAFADLNLVVTLFLITSFLTAGLQMPTARFVALYVADQNVAAIAALRRWGSWMAGWVGLALAAVFVLGAPIWAAFFDTESTWPFVILGLFVPFYLIQGIDRGVLQGQTRFRALAVSYQVEMWSRLALSVALVALGWAVNGAVVGVGLSFVAVWLVTRRATSGLPPAEAFAPQMRRELLNFVGPVLVAQLGQILINNSDVLIVRHFFEAESAGHYAALALIGRIVFFATWSVVTAMFPIVAQRHRRGEAHRSLLYLSLGAVLLVSFGIVGVTYLFPDLIVSLLFGAAYLSIAPLLWLYALATMFYALANVMISYRLSIGNTFGTYLAIAGGVAQVATLWFFHATLAQIVWVQVALMATLFFILFLWDLGRHIQESVKRPLDDLPSSAVQLDGVRSDMTQIDMLQSGYANGRANFGHAQGVRG